MNAQSKIEPAKSILGALAAALPELEGAKKNKANPAFKSKYADLGAVIEAIQPIAQYGLWFRQVSHEREDGVCVETFYIHESGELSAGKVFVPADKKNAQGYGSANSYARRYALQTAFGLATEDDDGNAAAKHPPSEATTRQAKAPAHSALKSKLREFVHTMEGCGDWDEWCAFRDLPESQQLIAEVRDNLPEWWEGGADMPAEFVPLRRRIELLEANFANRITDIARV